MVTLDLTNYLCVVTRVAGHERQLTPEREQCSMAVMESCGVHLCVYLNEQTRITGEQYCLLIERQWEDSSAHGG